MNLINLKRFFPNSMYIAGFIVVTSFMMSCFGKETNILPIRRVIDLDVGEKQTIALSDGQKVEVSLINIHDSVDKLSSAIRSAQAIVLIDGQKVVLNVANYHLPVTVGCVQVDCPVTRAYLRKSRHTRWKLQKDARLRFWPKDSPLLEPGTFVYPLKQRLFANDTQMANDPVYVNGGDKPGQKNIYYHSGLDFGGSEAREEVVSTVDGTVIITGNKILPEYKDKIPSRLMYDEVMILDQRGWHHGFFHLNQIDPAVYPGAKVKMGQRIGLLGKEGVAGGWCHLHYTIKSMQPSDIRGEEDAYAYVWEAYLNEYRPSIIAVARPHQFVDVNEKVILDGRLSKSFAGEIIDYQWIFSDGSEATGPTQEKTYTIPGSYSEVLKVTDSNGIVDYDYTVVQVVDMKAPEKLPPTIHAVYYPTLGIKAGDPITFGVRTFRTQSGHEEWDFGDGTEKVIVKSVVPKNVREGKYAETIHRYEKPGHYLARVERTDENGFKAIAHLHIEVEKEKHRRQGYPGQ